MSLLIASALKEFEPAALSERAGDRNFVGGRQIYKPTPIILNTFPGAFGVQIRIPNPDSRCRVKMSIIFFPVAGRSLIDMTGAGTIWVVASDEDQKGVSGSSGKTEPVTNLEGTQAAPFSFPQTAGLAGYSREFVTSADWIEATVNINTGEGVLGAWVLQTRIQPDAVTLDWGEWDEIRRLFLPQSQSL